MSTAHCQFVEVTAPRALEDQLIPIWWETGYAGVVEENDGDKVRWKVFFEADVHPEVLHDCAARCAALDPSVASHVQTQILADWSAQWKSFFTPFEVSPELVITTEGIPHTPRPGQKPIVIVAGMAFGTGQHPTTQLIARAVAKDFPERHWDRALDVGTGTGILGLVALGCGVRHVDGMDIDPDALVCAEENASKNDMLNSFSMHDTLETILPTYPCIVANILLDPLREMASTLTALLAPDADIYLSGILIDQIESLKTVYEAQGLRHVCTDTQGEWAMVHLRSA